MHADVTISNTAVNTELWYHSMTSYDSVHLEIELELLARMF